MPCVDDIKVTKLIKDSPLCVVDIGVIASLGLLVYAWSSFPNTHTQPPPLCNMIPVKFGPALRIENPHPPLQIAESGGTNSFFTSG
jgi:hypothetical protein